MTAARTCKVLQAPLDGDVGALIEPTEANGLERIEAHRTDEGEGIWRSPGLAVFNRKPQARMNSAHGASFGRMESISKKTQRSPTLNSALFTTVSQPITRARRMLSAASIGPSASRVRIEASCRSTENLR